jgi:type III restriction enzyme
MIESKMSSQVDALDVQAKGKAAERYCKYATDFTSQNNGKHWKYVIIPHNVVGRTMSFPYLISQFSD